MTTHHTTPYKSKLTGFIFVTLWLITQQVLAKDMISQNDIEHVNETFKTLVDENGNIHLPNNYRQNWGHMGSWTVLDESAPGNGFHDVYTQHDAIEAYLEKGHFPDGSVLIKEVRKIESGLQTTGHAQWAGDLKITFVMIKDEKGRFPDNKHWKEGWGWALFDAQNPLTNVSQGFEQSCYACHAPAKQTDWVYINGYPSLK